MEHRSLRGAQWGQAEVLGDKLALSHHHVLPTLALLPPSKPQGGRFGDAGGGKSHWAQSAPNPGDARRIAQPAPSTMAVSTGYKIKMDLRISSCLYILQQT